MNLHTKKKGLNTLMPKIERKAHEVEAAIEEDIEIQGKRFRVYFQNRYTILSGSRSINWLLLYPR